MTGLQFMAREALLICLFFSASMLLMKDWVGSKREAKKRKVLDALPRIPYQSNLVEVAAHGG
jgi:hypothetical protein